MPKAEEDGLTLEAKQYPGMNIIKRSVIAAAAAGEYKHSISIFTDMAEKKQKLKQVKRMVGQ